MKKFEIGKTYEGYNHKGKWIATIEKRTAKTITIDGDKFKIYEATGFGYETTESSSFVLRSTNEVK